jgi:hypothetical protein
VTRSDSAGPSGYDYLPAADYDDAEFNPASDYADDGFLASWSLAEEAEAGLAEPGTSQPPSETRWPSPESPASNGNVARPQATAPAEAEPEIVAPAPYETQTAEPAVPEPQAVQPEPVQPEPGQPEAVQPERTEPANVEPEVAQPAAEEVETAKPETAPPADPELTTIELELAQLVGAELTTAEPETARPEPAEPRPAEPRPAEPRPAEPRPAPPVAPSAPPAPPTTQPPTAQPPTAQPPTAQPPTAQPPTAQPPTAQPPTAQPATAQPTAGPPPTRRIRAGVTGLRTTAGTLYRPVRARLAQTQLDWPRLPQAREAEPGQSPSLRTRLAGYGRRCLLPAGFVVLGVVLFAAYLAQARTIPGTSEGGGQALQAWEMLHGNLLLRGWTMSDVSFYTTELPEYMLVEWIHGLNADTVHVAAALSYTLIVLLGGLLARGGPKGRASGREGLIRFFIAAGIMLAPPLSNTSLLLGDPDHTGTHVPLLLIFLVLDRAPRRWWTPVLITIMLTWAQVADTIVLYEAAVPIALAGLLRVNRRRGKLADNWFDLSLILGAAISAVAAKHILTLIKDAGGFIVKTPNLRFTTASALQQGTFTDLSRTLDVFGAKFFGMRVGADAAGTLLRFAGLALVVWAVAAGLRRLYRADTEILVQVLTLGFVILLIAYVVSTKNDENEIVGLLPLGAVLAGRLLTPPVIRNKLVPVLAVVLLLYAGMLAANTAKPANMGRDTEFGAWLKARGLNYGLGNFWNSTNTTVDTGGRVMVRPVRTFDDRIVTTLSESSGAWYDPRQHYANFIVSSRWWLCGGVCVGLNSARQSFGPPSVTYSFHNWRVLVYNKNLLARLRIVSWCDEGWPWNTPKAPSPVVCRN